MKRLKFAPRLRCLFISTPAIKMFFNCTALGSDGDVGAGVAQLGVNRFSVRNLEGERVERDALVVLVVLGAVGAVGSAGALADDCSMDLSEGRSSKEEVDNVEVKFLVLIRCALYATLDATYDREGSTLGLREDTYHDTSRVLWSTQNIRLVS